MYHQSLKESKVGRRGGARQAFIHEDGCLVVSLVMEVQGTSIFGQRCLFEWEDLFYGMKHNVQCIPKTIPKNS